MAQGDWNFLAGRLNGDGSIEITETELPITVTSIDQNLSTPSGMTGKIQNAAKRFKVAGRPVFEPWNTAILAVADDVLRGLTIYRKPTFNGSDWDLDLIGFGGYPQGMPYDGEQSYIRTDPFYIYRHIWEHLQSKPRGNLGVTVSQNASPIVVGSPEVEGDNSSGPRKLNWWDTKDLGAVIDSLSKETPFDWLERVYWDGDQPHCHIDLGYPQIGVQRSDLRLVLGENLATEPTTTEGDFANEAWAYGAGEGRERVRGTYGVSDDRLRRITTVEDDTWVNREQATAAARDQLAMTRGQLVVDSLEVYDHPNAPLEGIELGDEIPLYAETPYVDIDTLVRVVGKSQDPTRGDVAKLTVVRMVTA